MHDKRGKLKQRLCFWQLLKPASISPRLTDQKTIDKKYRYWRMRILYSTYIGYAVFYLTRKSFTFAMPVMLKTLPITKADLGLMATSFYVIYGVSKFISGMLSDRSNPRYFMAFGLIATGIIHLLLVTVPASVPLMIFVPLIIVLWGINGFFQGWGWPPCARLLTHWYSKDERGRWWATWNTSHNVGGALIPLLIAAILYYFHTWQWAMIIPGIIAIVIGLLLINRLRDVPTSLGLPPIEQYRKDSCAIAVDDSSKHVKQPIFKIFVQYILKNRHIWLLAMAYVMIYVIRTAINDWGAVYLSEKGLSIIAANSAMTLFEIGGLVGSLLAGYFSDWFFNGRRGEMNVIYGVGCFIVLSLFWWIQDIGWSIGFIFGLGFLVFGPQMLIGMAAAELSHREAAGTATGFVGLFGYLGAALSGWPIGMIIQHFHWSGFFMTIVFCSVLSVIFLIPLFNANERPKFKGVDY